MEIESEEVKTKVGGFDVEEKDVNEVENNLESPKESSNFLENNSVNFRTNCSRPSMLTSDGSNAHAPMPTPHQLTIFYGGRVFVFDAIPEEKVHEIFIAAATVVKSGEIKKTGSIPPASTPVLTRSSSLQSTASILSSPQTQLYPIQNPSLCKFQAELPIARRNSLQRFLEKRRDRLASKNPYPTLTAGKTVEIAKVDPVLKSEDSTIENSLAQEEIKTEVTENLA